MFNKPMEKFSVESSFTIQPSLTGSFSLVGTTMAFTPSAPLLDQTYYTATVGPGARDLTGSQLDCTVLTWSFFTGPPPTERRHVGTGTGDF